VSEEPLAVLLLPSRLEEFERGAHARDLLTIPRVVALEASSRRTPRFLREAAPLRQAKRLRFPGQPRLLVLYHPAQYPLARGLRDRYEAELWYMRAELGAISGAAGFTREELLEFDELARERAVHWREVGPEAAVASVNETLRIRLRELEIISARPFVPGARVVAR
jgi:hypothetical protein